MQDDIAAALTQEVKEEVIENYLYERRLVEGQINYVKELAEQAAQLQGKLSWRFARVYDLLPEASFLNEFVRLIEVEGAPFMDRFSKVPEYRKGVRFIKVHGFTDRGRFKKLLSESYRRLLAWNDQYTEAYEDLEQECKAVNDNLKKFEDDYDLLTILNFLRDMDVEGIQRKHFLGDNFTPEEIGSIETSLRFKPIRIEQFKLIPPPSLPKITAIQRQLNALADSVYGQCCDRVKVLIK
jgi:hypothetical protein